jgi:hypothetical protein
LKLFPTRFYRIELNDSSQFLNELKSNSLPRKIFVTDWSKQIFIGEVNSDEFKLMLSYRILGSYCEFHGRIDKNKTNLVHVEVNPNKYFKMFFKIVLICVFFVAILQIINYQFKALLALSIHILIIRLVYIELGFRFFFKKGLKKLKKTNGLKSIKEVSKI